LLQFECHASQLFVYGGIIMEAMREAWTDERLDDLTKRVDRGFIQADGRATKFEDRVDARFEKLEGKLQSRFDRIDNRFERMDERLERFEARMTSRFEWLLRFMLASYVTALIGYFAAHS
jgi:hypothetical protein